MALSALHPHPSALKALFLLLVFSLFPLAFAHPANVASSQAKVQPDGTFVMRVRFDIAAFVTNATPKDAADGAMNDFLDGTDEAMKAALADAEARFRAGFASGGTIDRFAFPTVADVRAFLAGDPKPRLPAMLTATVEGHLPSGVRTIAFRYPSTLDTVIQTVEFPYKEPISEPVEGGRASATLTIPTADEVAKLAAAMSAPRGKGGGARAEGGKVATKAPEVGEGANKPKPAKPASVLVGKEVAPKSASLPLKPKQTKAETPKTETHPLPTLPQGGGAAAATPLPATKIPYPATDSPPPSAITPPSALAPPPFVTYLRMGFTHILPEGIDHILFVLGLFLLGSNAKALLKQITAFTVAHSITLALATLHVVRLPGRVIEPLIALSIAFVAIENLFAKEVKPWRTAVVFLFGLVHGMGFAEVFADAGLSGRGLIAALLSFNVGVELGQLSVVAMALGVVGWFRGDVRYRRYVVVPGSLLIAAAGLFWTVERIVG